MLVSIYSNIQFWSWKYPFKLPGIPGRPIFRSA